MSDPLEQEFDDFQPRRSSRARILLFVVVGVIVAIFLVSMFASLYTDRLWYSSVGYTRVFDTMLWTRVGLFVGFGLLMGGAVAANMVIAYRARPFHRPDSPEQTGLDRYRDAVAPIRTLLLVSVAGVIGLFGGVAANGQWRTFLLWANRVPFHTSDYYFHKDVGFYVFTLPWLHFLVGFVIAVLVLSALSALVVHYLYGGIRLQATSDRMSTTATIQLSVLVGLALLAKAVGYWLDRYDLVTGSGKLVTGMGYTDQHAVLPARNILVGVALICAVLFFLTVWRRTWLLPGVGISLLLVTSILLGLIWPAFVQHFQVDPTELDKESPYIEQNIDATREAYDLGDIQEVQAPKKVTGGDGAGPDRPDGVGPGARPVADLAGLPADPAGGVVLLGAQRPRRRPLPDPGHRPGARPRRARAGPDRDHAGPAELDEPPHRLHPRQRRDRRVRQPAARRQRRREPADPVGGGAGTRAGLAPEVHRCVREPGLLRRGQHPDYSIVGKAPGAHDVELDLTANGTRAQTTYAGGGGVAVGSFFHKLMYAVKFGDSNFLLSGRVGPDSKVLYYRNPVQRVEKVAPWLTLDSDVYPTIVDGRILWVVDGYTTTDQYPQAERDSFQTMTTDSLTPPSGVRTLPSDQVNYVRNAVKATVDAYTGKVTLYAWDESDPMLQAWRSAFPDTVEDKDQIPPDLHAAPALPRGHVQGAALPVRALPRDRRDRLLPGQQPVGGARGPGPDRQQPDPDPDVQPRPRDRSAGVVAAVQLRAAGQVQPGRRGRRGLRRDVAGLRQDPGREAAQRERPGSDAGLQQPDLRPADHAQDAEVQARRRHHAVRQRDLGAARVRPDVRRTGVCARSCRPTPRRTSPCAT